MHLSELTVPRNSRKTWDKRRSRDRRGREKPARTSHEVANERSGRVVPPPSREVKRLLETLESYQIYYLDPQRGNIVFPDMR